MTSYETTQFEKLYTYHSEFEDQPGETIGPLLINRKVKVFKEWLLDIKLDHDKDVDSFLENEPHWSLFHTNPSSIAGTKVECNKVKPRGPQCAAALLLQ